MFGAESLLTDLKRFFEEGLRLGVPSDVIGEVTRLPWWNQSAEAFYSALKASDAGGAVQMRVDFVVFAVLGTWGSSPAQASAIPSLERTPLERLRDFDSLERLHLSRSSRPVTQLANPFGSH